MNVIRFSDLIAAGKVAGQRVFIRADLNVPQDDDGKITEVESEGEVDASSLAVPLRETPPTVRTPGIVAGAPTSSVPLPLLPAATTTTTSCENA